MLTSPASSASSPQPLLLLAAVTSAGILAPLNSTMLAVALPDIREEFGVSHAAIGWLVSSYLIAMAVAQPLGGRLGDQMGRARVFRLGLLAFLFLSGAAALAPTFELLVVLRTGQALTAAALIPNGMALLRLSVPANRLGRLFGLHGAGMSIAAASGPLIGAILLDVGSWRALFVMNIPVVAIALLLQLRFMEADRVTARRVSLDWLGAQLFAASLVALTFILGGLRGNHAPMNMVLVTLVFVATSIWLASRLHSHPAPAIDWRLFRLRSFAAGTLHVLLTNLVMYTTLLTVPFFMREVRGGGIGETGLLLGAMSIMMAVVAPIAGRISDAAGRRVPTVIGSVLALFGALILLVTVSETAQNAPLAFALGVVGLGVGLAVGPAATAAIESAPASAAASASGTNSMMRYLGSIIGAGLLAGVLSTGGGAIPGIDTFRLIFLITALMALAAIPAACVLHQFPREADDEGERHSERPSEPPAPSPAVRLS